MSACLSRLVLSSWEAEPVSGRSAEIFNHVNSCTRCSSIVSDISESRALLLGADPESASLRAATAILDKVVARRRTSRFWRFLLPGLLLPATVAGLLVLAPALRSPVESDRAGGIRIKGSLIVEGYCKRGEEVFPIADGSEYVEGDRLRFSYTKDVPGNLMVFSVDDHGVVSPYYQENGLSPLSVAAGTKVMLPGSIELDNHKGWERVFAVWSQSPIADDHVRKAVAAALSAADGDIRRISTLDLPAEQVSFLLRRL